MTNVSQRSIPKPAGAFRIRISPSTSESAFLACQGGWQRNLHLTGTKRMLELLPREFDAFRTT
jgi:hypothetical protein